MKRIGHFLFVRHRHNWWLFFKFGMVGASGVVVNQLVLFIQQILGPKAHLIFVDLPATDFNVRWYHVYVTIAFFVANLWNFQLNRGWTFRSGKHASWFSEYVPFLLVGLIALAMNLPIVTVLMHPQSVFALPSTIGSFDTRLQIANLIAIAIITPLSFVFNKIWTFSSVRGK